MYFLLLENRIIGLHCRVPIYIFIQFLSVGSVKLFYFCKSDVSAVQGHPRSLILALIEGVYATSH